MTQYLLPDKSQYTPRERLLTILPVLEFAVEGCYLSVKQALIELGFDVDKLAEEEKVQE